MSHTTKLPRRQARDQAYEAGLDALALARQQLPQALQHRAMRRERITPWRIAQLVILPLVFFAGVWICEPYLFRFWHHSMLLWAELLGLPLRAVGQPDVADLLAVRWESADSLYSQPSDATLASVAVMTMFLYLLTYRMAGKLTPVKYLARIVCGILAITVAYFWLFPDAFPYTMESHARDIANTGYITMLAIPLMLAMGYYVLDVNLARKVLFTALTLSYFALLVPHQAVLHLLVLHHFSMLFMPLLYITLGALFNMLLFVALYAWMASMVPARSAG